MATTLKIPVFNVTRSHLDALWDELELCGVFDRTGGQLVGKALVLLGQLNPVFLFWHKKGGYVPSFLYCFLSTTSVELTPSVAKLLRLRVSQKPTGRYVTSKPSLVKRSGWEENAQWILDTLFPPLTGITKPIIHAVVSQQPNKRNHQLLTILGEYQPGYYTTIITVAPGVDLVESDQDYVILVNSSIT
ncbi:hypothetical protein FRB98_005734 [Tulasnella sp. 332]|nr:hypothetical protein FRB98_005734 [Tulasnella sp. 332]